MATIFFLSHIPGDDLPSTISGLDKIYHAVAYGILALSCLYAVQPWFRDRPLLQMAVPVVIFSFLFGLGDEFHQTFIEHRSADFRDLVADVTGSILAVFFWWSWRRRNIR